MSQTLTRLAVSSLLFAGLALTGCGDPAPSGPPPLPTPAEAAAPAGSRFEIPVPIDGVPPIQVEVVEAGNGPLATTGLTAVHHMRLQAEKADKPLIDSWAKGATRETVTGLGRVEPGLDMVLVKMRKGDRWKAVLPPQIMFAGHAGPNLPANSVMNAEIHVLDVKR